MEITQQVRDYAAQQGQTPAAAQQSGTQQKSEEFRKQGGKIYS